MPYTILSKACDVYSIETAFLGYDTITKERLTDDEASIRAITGTLSFATLIMGWGQAGGVAEGVVIYMSMAAADSAQVLTTYGLEQLEAPPLVTAIISTTVGMGVGALAFKVGNTYAKPYDAGNGGVFDGIDKDAAFPKYANKGVSGTKEKFTWKLRGENVTLDDVVVDEIAYIKRDSAELMTLRDKFNTTTRKLFLQDLGKNTDYLRNAGFSDIDIMKIQNGRLPDGWQVHHKLPLDDSGTNSFENLVLIQNEPYHKTITNYQNSIARQLQIGETQTVKWPIPNGNIYPEVH